MKKTNTSPDGSDNQAIDSDLEAANGGSFESAAQDILESPFRFLSLNFPSHDEMKKRHLTGTDGILDHLMYQYIPNTMNEKVDNAINSKLADAVDANIKADQDLKDRGLG